MASEEELDIRNVMCWSIDDVVRWLNENKFGAHVDKFREHGINGVALVMLDEDDIKQLIHNNIGDRKNFYFNIKKLKLRYNADSNSEFNGDDSDLHDSTSDSIHKLSGHICEMCLRKYENSNDFVADIHFKNEKRKTFVSFLYLVLTSLWTAFILTVVHDRVPDMQKYPPLPDIILDNVPLMSWAFYWAETIGLILAITTLIILYFHKYRWIVFRRLCSLAATIFLLRSVTMLITSLSVPGIHLQCSSQQYGSLRSQLAGAWQIFSGVGLAVHGVRTCGDYMFSGHTVWLTLCTHFICEYTPYTMNWFHTIVWVMNIFGLFFILAAHEHYSIDVFIAFYITSRLFLYYHSLANNKVLFQRDQRRVRIWFPLFSYFESNIHLQIPNEYEGITPYIYTLIMKKIRNYREKKKNKKLK